MAMRSSSVGGAFGADVEQRVGELEAGRGERRGTLSAAADGGQRSTGSARRWRRASCRCAIDQAGAARGRAVDALDDALRSDGRRAR